MPKGKVTRTRYIVKLWHPINKTWLIGGRFAKLNQMEDLLDRNYPQIRAIYEGKAKKDCKTIKIEKIVD